MSPKIAKIQPKMPLVNFVDRFFFFFYGEICLFPKESTWYRSFGGNGSNMGYFGVKFE